MNNESLLSSQSNKKRGNGETLDLKSILSLDNNKKKSTTEKQRVEENPETPGTLETTSVTSPQTTKPAPPTTSTSIPAPTNINNLEEFEIDKLENQNLEQLIEIAKFININSKRIRKQDLIDSIKMAVRIKRESIEAKIKKETNNPFNKTSFNELVILDGQDGINELLFWKVFKNKPIYKHIMSFMNIYPNPLPYEYFISVRKMLDSNQISILKDKVKRNRYLSFSQFIKYSSNKQTWVTLFEKIQDLHGDKEFYQHLFKNYIDQVPLEHGFEINDRLNCIAVLLIESNCLIGLMVLIQHFNYLPNNLCFIIAFKNCKIDCINFLLSTIKSTNGSGIVKCIVGNDNNEQEISFDKSIYDQILPPYFQEVFIDPNRLNLLESIELLLITFKPPKETIQPKLILLFQKNPMDLKLNYLVNLIGMLDTLDLWNNYENSKFKYPIEQAESFTKSISTLKDEIKLFKFSNQQLESTLNDPINFSTSEKGEKENIKSLLDIYFKIGEYTENEYMFTEYYICYGEKGNGYVSTHELNYILAFEHGHYQTLLNYQSKYSGDLIVSSLLNTSHKQDYLFSKCKQDKQLQISFINSLIQDSKSSQNKKGIFKYPHGYLFVILLNFDDFQLVEMLVSQVGKESILNSFHRHYVISKYIKSIKVVQYLFKEFTELMGIKGSNIKHCHMSDVNLISEFNRLFQIREIKERKLNPQLDIQNVSMGQILVTAKEYPVKLVEFLLTHLVFPALKSEKPIDFDQCQENREIYFKSLKSYIINTTPISKIHIDLLGFIQNQIYKEYPPIYYIDYLKWLYNFKKLDYGSMVSPIQFKCYQLNINRSYNNDISPNIKAIGLLKILEYVTIGSKLPLTPLDVLQEYHYLIKHIINRGDLKTLDIILNILLKSIKVGSQLQGKELEEYNSIKMFIYRILKCVIKCQQISVLEYLYLNYNQLFKIKQIVKTKSSKPTTKAKQVKQINENNDEDDSLFTLQELRELVFESLSEFNLKISEFLISLYPITLTQLRKNSDNSSYINFKNKIKN